MLIDEKKKLGVIMLINNKQTYYKDGCQGRNYYLEGSEVERWRYNPFRLKNRQIAEEAYNKNWALPAPLHGIIEVSSICNLRCGFCNRDAGLARPQKNMELEVFKDVVDQFAEAGVYSLSLYCLGEPFLNTDLRKMIEYTKGRGIQYCDVSTNGMHDMDLVLGTSLNEIIISIDGFKKTHEHLRPGASWEKIVANLERLYWQRKRGKHQWPVIRLQIIDLPETHGEISKFIDWGLNYADVVYVKRVEAFAQNLNTRNMKSEEIEARKKERKACKQLSFVLTVNSDGGIAGCCHDSHCKSVLIAKTIKEAWKELDPIRVRHRRGDYSDFGGLCRNCCDFEW